MNQVVVLIDWENVRKRLADNYVESVNITRVMDAFEKVVKEIGKLRRATFFGDFTLRRDEARVVQSRPLFEYKNVLRSVSQRDQTDPVIVADIMQTIYTEKEVDTVLLGAGDSTYCDVVRRAFQHGKDVRICAVGVDVSTELASLAPLFPIERYLDIPLTRRTSRVMPATLPTLSPKDVSKWMKLVKLLQQLEATLSFVGLSYFQNTIMPSYRLGGQTGDDRFAYLETARELDIIAFEEIDNPTRPGYKMRAIKLNRENELVKEILALK